jgi:hypothetical protein
VSYDLRIWSVNAPDLPATLGSDARWLITLSCARVEVEDIPATVARHTLARRIDARADFSAALGVCAFSAGLSEDLSV